jgi:hypothetical protein
MSPYRLDGTVGSALSSEGAPGFPPPCLNVFVSICGCWGFQGVERGRRFDPFSSQLFAFPFCPLPSSITLLPLLPMPATIYQRATLESLAYLLLQLDESFSFLYGEPSIHISIYILRPEVSVLLVLADRVARHNHTFTLKS